MEFELVLLLQSDIKFAAYIHGRCAGSSWELVCVQQRAEAKCRRRGKANSKMLPDVANVRSERYRHCEWARVQVSKWCVLSTNSRTRKAVGKSNVQLCEDCKNECHDWRVMVWRSFQSLFGRFTFSHSIAQLFWSFSLSVVGASGKSEILIFPGGRFTRHVDARCQWWGFAQPNSKVKRNWIGRVCGRKGKSDAVRKKENWNRFITLSIWFMDGFIGRIGRGVCVSLCVQWRLVDGGYVRHDEWHCSVKLSITHYQDDTVCVCVWRFHPTL